MLHMACSVVDNTKDPDVHMQDDGTLDLLEKKSDINILEALKHLRDQRKYCDVVLEVRGIKLEAHKNILASWSPYLASKLYADSHKLYRDYVIVHYDNSEVFSDLLDFMYNGYVALRESNFCQLLHLAVSFQIETLKNYCEEFLRCNLHLGNFVSTYFLSRKFQLENLEEYIVGFLQLNLSDAVKQGEFLSLKAEKFNSFLSEGWMKKIKPEIKLFLIISWVSYDVHDREKYLVLLLGHIHWSTVAHNFLDEINNTDNFFTSHESSLYLLLQILYSAGISLGPYKEIFPQLREVHSAILKDVVHTTLHADADNFHPVTITVRSRPVIKDSTQNTDISWFNLKEMSTNTDVASPDFEKSVVVDNTAKQNGSVATLEEPSELGEVKYEQFESLGEFIEAEILEIKQKEKLSKQQDEHVETIIVDTESESGVSRPVLRRSSRKTTRSNTAALKKIKKVRDSDEEDVNTNKGLENQDINIVNENEYIEEESEDEYIPDQKEEEESDSEFELRTYKTSDAILSHLKGKKRSKKHKLNRTDSKPIMCKFDDCAYITKFTQRMEKHVKTVHEATFELRCNLCPFETKEVRKYNSHMKFHFPGPPYKCDFPRCMFSADKIQTMLTHRSSHTDERPFLCECGMRFRTNNTLIAHKKVHLGRKDFTCPECGVAFATKNTLNQHRVTHSDIRPYLCDLCGFSTKFQSHLIAHKRIHSGEVFSCQFPSCGYFTPKRSQLKAHMRAHLGIRSHICDTCGKTFVEKSHLVRHERLHTNTRLQCEQCEYTTTRKDKLKEHFQKHHSTDALSKPKKTKTANSKKSKRASETVKDTADTAIPMTVKWDHGGYSMAQQEALQDHDAGPLLNEVDNYCMLREHIGNGEQMPQILSIDQINAQISSVKRLDSTVMVNQGVETMLPSTGDNGAQSMTLLTSSIPCLSFTTTGGNMQNAVTSAMDHVHPNGHTYTIIQASNGSTSQQQEFGGLNAFMALF